MVAFARRSPVVLFGAFVLAPFLNALPTQGVEDECVHLTGYAGQAQSAPVIRARRSALSSGSNGTHGGTLAAGICAVDNARFNTPTPTKTNADFVPVAGDDSLGFYCVYGVKASSTGGVGGNVGIFLFELAGGEVLVFGSGYGNIQGANLFDAAYDMERVDQVIRYCMGKDPATTPLRLLAPHGHADHINPAANRELERLGYTILEIAFHPADFALINGMAWTTADRGLFRLLPSGTNCLEQLATYASPLGNLWVYHRPGHTDGSIDLVVDVKNDVDNRFVVRGSQASSPCAPLSGQREAVDAHGNAVLFSVPPSLADVTPLAGTAQGGTPLTVSGAMFTASGAGTPTVLVDGVPATAVVVTSDSTLTCTTPAGPPGELVEVALVNNNGKAVYAGTFFYNPLPAVTSIAPITGDWRGGTVVQVRGSGFLLSAGVNEVFFGATRASQVTVKSDALLTCRAPAGTPGAVVTVQLRNPNGEAKLDNAFRYSTNLAITAVDPPSASALGGTIVLLTGVGFSGTGTTPAVTFGGTASAVVTLLSDTTVLAVVPPGPQGTNVDVVLTNSAGSATFTGFRYHAFPRLTSLSPTTGRDSGGTTVTLSGSGYLVDGAGTNQVRFGGAPAAQVTVLSDGSLRCAAPAGTRGNSVNVTVSNQNGTAALPLAYTYTGPLEVTSILPVAGTSLGGTTVTLAGTGFVDGPAGTTTVRFGGVLATNVVAVDNLTLSCRAPAGTPQAVVDLEVSNQNGTVTLPGAYRYHARPTLTAVTPNHGLASATTQVTLTGTGFLANQAGTNAITVGGVPAANVTVVSDTSISCRFPAGTPGTTVNVALSNLNGSTTLTGGFRYHAAPTLSAVTPDHGRSGGSTAVTLGGTGFLNDQAGVNVITVGGTAATNVTVLSDTSLTCSFPGGTAGSTVNVVLTNLNGSVTLTGGFRYHAPPTLTAVTPNHGNAGSFTAVTVTGTGFLNDQAGTNTLTVGGNAATSVQVVSDTSLLCNFPPGTPGGSVNVVLANQNGSATLTNGYRYHAPPTLTGISPASGGAAQQQRVTLAGSGFLNDQAGTPTITFGGLAASAVSVTNDTSLRCNAPVGPAGETVDIVLTNVRGAATLPQAYRFHARPTLAAVTPSVGSSQGGTPVTLTGSGFLVDGAGINVVNFGGSFASSVVVVSDTTLRCTTPAGVQDASVDVVVSNTNGTASLADAFSYSIAPPVVSAVSPPSGPAQLPGSILLTGSGFLAGGAGPNTVRFGSQAAVSVTALDDTRLSCQAPPGTPGTQVDVTVSNANGQGVLARAFRYHAIPALTSISPLSGSAAGGTLVTLTGTGFVADAAGPNTVTFGGLAAQSVTVVSNTTLTCLAPAGASGATVDVRVSNANGQTGGRSFAYHPRPMLLGVMPASGPTAGGTRVVLRGSGFQANGAGANAVRFGKTSAANVTVVSDTEISCITPRGDGGFVDVSVSNKNGLATLVRGFHYGKLTPTITSIEPPSGPGRGQNLVTIRGHGFAGAGANAVRFGAALATGVVTLDDETLQCTVPAGAAGTRVDVALTNETGATTLAQGYRYHAHPTLVAISPTQGEALEETRVSLTGSGFAADSPGENVVLFGGIRARDVQVKSDGLLTCRAMGGGPGSVLDVTVRNVNGSATLDDAYRVIGGPPTIEGLSPRSGPFVGGTLITITGRGYDAGSVRVTFGDVPALDVRVLGPTQVTCLTPPGTVGSVVTVALSNKNGAAVLIGGFTYEVIRPQLTGLAPDHGPAAGGTRVTLSGSGFTATGAGAARVSFDGIPATNVVVVGDTSVTCNAPAGTAGTSVDVVLENSNGRSVLALAFRYHAQPTLTAIAPAVGRPQGGTLVTLTGSGFAVDAPGPNQVLFEGVPALSVSVISNTLLACTTPPGVVDTNADVRVTNANGSATLGDAFRYRNPPQITGVIPGSGPTAGGTTLTLTGTGFQANSAGVNRVTIGGVPALDVVTLGDTALTCTTGAATAGAKDVMVANDNGSATATGAFTYLPGPGLTSIAPDHGPARGGTRVTVTGTGFFAPGAGQNRVYFGGVLATSLVASSDTTLACTAPAGPAGARVDVRIENALGTATLAAAFRYHEAPVLTQVSPDHGSRNGVAVTLIGRGFQLDQPGTNAIAFGGVPATQVVVLSDTQLTCRAPAGLAATHVDVTLANVNGTSTLPAAFRYHAEPALTAVAPARGPSAGGIRLTLTGTGFQADEPGVTQVVVGGSGATDVSVVSDTSLTCVLPAGPVDARVNVTVANSNGQTTLVEGFRYNPLPTLTAISPALGAAAGGTSVTLTGSGFVLGNPGPNTVLFGGVAATIVSVPSDNTLVCLAPAGTAGASVDVSLTNLSGTATLPAAFRYRAQPALSAVAPDHGPASGGTAVTLSGSGFASGGPNAVTFAGVPATSVVVVDDFTLTCVAPAGTPGARADVRLTNADGEATLPAAFRYHALPVVSGISPASGPALGGTTVTLSGSGFASGAPNAVSFAGVPATNVVVVDDATLTCVTPAGTPGATVDVGLANLDGAATLVASFLYRGGPVLAAVAPDHGPAQGNTAVTLTGSGFAQGGPNTVRFGATLATSVVVVDDATLTCMTPAGTAGTSVDVRVANANGAAVLVAAFRYHALPVLSGISPASGLPAGGTAVTLSGSGFASGAPNAVSFAGVPATNVVVVDDATLTCVTPAGTPGATVDVDLANLDGAATLVAGFLYRGGPVLAAITPNHGPAPGNTAVTLTGSGFAQGGPNTVRFGATLATSVVVVNDSTLTCRTPQGPPGTSVDVRVSNADGASVLVAGYRYHALPVLSAIAPNHGPATGGTAVTLTGSGFTGGTNTVRFAGIQATAVVVVSDTTLTCVTPAGTAGASVDVRVTNPDGTTLLPRSFRYHARPVLAAVAPTHGSSRNETLVSLSGSGFLNDDPGTNAVLFGAAAPLAVTVVNDATLSCRVAPQGAGSVVDVRVTNANGQATLAAAFTFDAAAPPSLAGLSPASGPALGGTTVTLSGTGFQDPSAGTTTVAFGAASATGVVVVDDATVRCQTPPGTPGTAVDVRLSNQNGSALLAAAFTYLAPAPTLAGLLPVSGPGAGGGTVTLTGSGFVANGAGTNTVTFGGVAASAVVVVDDATLTCHVPAGGGGTQVDVELRNANGAAELAAGYRYHRLPAITSVSPAGGTSLGGTPVTVRGSGFLVDAAGTVTVKFADKLATTLSVPEDGRLTCRAPSGTPGASVAVTVTCANGEVQLLDGFKYSPTPTVTGVTPADGTALGGTRVTVSGTGFLANGASQNAVTFGSTRATSVVVRTDRLIDCTVPPGASGQSVTVTVNNVNGAGSLASGYRYHRRPTLVSLSPAEGPLEGGTLVTLTGTGFQVDAPGTNRVTFGGAQATAVSVLGDTSLTCITPGSAASGTVDVVITNDNGANTLLGSFTYGAVPIVAAALPGKGTTRGSTTVTLTGSGFQPGATVFFGTEAATNVVVVDERTLECQTPPYAASTWVDVTVRSWSGSACLPLGFLYAAPPTLTAVDPPTGNPQGGSMVVLTGSGFVANGAGENRVSFAGVDSANVSVLDDAHIACEVPPGQALSEADVVVTNENGTALLQRGFGWKMLLATDLNSDGRGDVILGSPNDDTLGNDAGAVRVFFGSPLPVLDRSSTDADLTALPERVATAFGMPVASGDLDGDGDAELVIGAPLDDRQLRDAGAVYVFAGPLSASSALTLSQATKVLTGQRQHDRFGTSLALRDLDRDGVLDLLVGMPDNGGAVHLFRGGAGGLARQTSVTIAGTSSNEGFASSLGAGDLDGDGWSEIVVGAPTALGLTTGGTSRPGVVRVFHGGPNLFAAGSLSPWLVFSGVEAGEGFGSDLSVADLTADGIEDLVIGSPWNSAAGLESGAAFAFFGGPGIAGGVAAGAQAILEAEGPADGFGMSLATGDVDGDDRADLLVGAPLWSGSGRAYLFRGGAGFADRSAAQADVLLQAESGSQGEFGSSVALIDVDGNGLADMVVTAPRLDAAGADIGRVYVFGSSPLPTRAGENDDATLTGKSAGELLGRSTTGDL